MPLDIYAETEKLWNKFYADIHREAPPRSEFQDLYCELEEKNRTIAVKGLQPALGIFEFGLEWLMYVHFALSNEKKLGPKQPNFAVPWALVGSGTAFGLSLRNLCLTGFDTPARALLRSYTEALFLCLAILDDNSLGVNYQNADNDLEVKNFWHSVASPKNLHERIIRLEKKIGLPEDAIQEFTAWRREEYEILAQSAHLSYGMACLTSAPALLEDEETHHVGILGRATANSRRTLSFASKTTWYFSRLVFDMLLGNSASDNSLLIVDKENDWHQRIVLGRDVLSQITTEHWDD